MGPVVGYGVYRVVVGQEQQSMLEQLSRDLSTGAFWIEREIVSGVEALYSLQAQVSKMDPLSQDDFHEMTGPIIQRHPSLQALEWVPKVTAENRRIHEEQSSLHGNRTYAITKGLDRGELKQAGERDLYYPVQYVDPFPGNERVVGYDLGSNPERMKALQKAEHENRLVITGSLSLVQGGTSPEGFLMILPVSGNQGGITAGKTSGIRGFVVAVFRSGRLTGVSLFHRASSALGDIHFQLIESEGGSDQTEVIITRYDRLVQNPDLSCERYLKIGDRTWRLVAYPTDAFLTRMFTRNPLRESLVIGGIWELLVILGVVLIKLARDRAKRREARITRAVISSISEGIIVSDLNGEILMANDAARSFFGSVSGTGHPSEWPKQYGIYRPGTEQLYSPEELPLLRAIRGETFQDSEVYVRNEKIPEGAHLNASGVPLQNEDGANIGGVVVFRNVTDQKASEERMKQLSNAVEQTADAIFITDHEGTIQYVNPAFEEMTGFSEEEAIGRTPAILKSGLQDDGYYKELWHTILEGRVFRATVVNQKKSGGTFFAEQTITPMKNGNGAIHHFVSVLKDMTESRKLQEQEFEMAIAANVQKRLFPTEAPVAKGYDIAGKVFPARMTCGDYFDFLPMPGGNCGMVVADVCGKGIGPALVMAETRAFLRSLSRSHANLSSIMETLNQMLVQDLEEASFVTLLIASLNLQTGQLGFANAGHPPGFILDSHGTVRDTLSATGLPLGMFPDATYQCRREISLQPGDLLLFVTDGVLECENEDGVPFGEERLLDVLKNLIRLPSVKIVDAIYDAVKEFSSGNHFQDDITILVCRREEPRL